MEDVCASPRARRESASTASGDDAETTEPVCRSRARFAERWRAASPWLGALGKDLGMAGMTAYGVLNTLYYALAFTTAWSSDRARDHRTLLIQAPG